MFNEIHIKRKVSSSPLTFRSGEVPYLTAPPLEKFPSVIHGFSTRLGGVSSGCFSSMNLSFTRGDRAENVMENYIKISSAMGFDPQNIVASSQTHTVNIKKAEASHRGRGFNLPKDYTDIDGLITNVPEVVLTTFFADCVPLLLFDPVKKVIGSAHSGWKGTVNKIGKNIVGEMTEAYGSNPKDIVAVIGPSVCQECYEVSRNVIDMFKTAYAPSLWDKLFYPTLPGKYRLNLWNACLENFLEAGIPSENISLPDICTCCNPQFLYSHRADGESRGGGAVFIMLSADA